ncbi:MAG: redox-sensitive transcriptional activator SoxR [Porticoccaceae bacterium]|mgnify:CR=1 FL=1|jgi:MerR family transcriptional regulator, redox-sensitive transcriptional activator SoxR|nr:redox-sensitive transcriptional activator SoxR [Porticoccaceae bacterium]
MTKLARRIGIGKVADRTGLSVSAIRFYEAEGLVSPIRNSGGQRQFLPSDIRRLSFVLIAQQLGFPLAEIRSRLISLPMERTPTQKDWQKISSEFRQALQERIDIATRMRDRLDGCIGCGCLSLDKCALYNPEDKFSRVGAGPQYILSNTKSS